MYTISMFDGKNGLENKGKHFIPSVKYGGGSVMIWRGFVAGGSEALVKNEGIIDFA